MINARRFVASSLVVGLLAGAAPAQPNEPAGLVVDAFEVDAAQLGRMLNGVPDPGRIRAYHDLLASDPHDAGTPGDAAVVENIERLFREFGLTTERQELQLYLAKPISGSVWVYAPDIIQSQGDEAERTPPPVGNDRPALSLPVREEPVANDPFSRGELARSGWNAYSGSGDVTGEVVYANYGRLEDFERLADMGVDLTGRVVLARYGGNFRGYKAKYAEEAGAAALIMYTDPADAGWGRGLPYPEGGYANDSHIQRGSIKTLDYPGDPLTPFEPAVEGARRLNPERVGLPTIPVQPIGWGAAEQILSRMTGESVPDGWQGGLPFRYRVTGGEDLSVRVAVEQERELVTTWNVIGRLEGSAEPEREVYIGCHHDAWGFGAGDPMAGMICLLESARSFGEMASQGVRPRRSLVFCAWGAEEHGIIGSVEFVEARARELGQNAVAYLNLDMAAMGPDFRSSASPSLRTVIAEAAGDVAQARDPGRTVLGAWRERGEDPGVEGSPRFGDLGGGSDHVGFLCHACIPSASLGGGGARGVAYHSIYDNLAWYRAVVGDDYEPALMVTRMTNAVAARLAHDEILPLDPARYGPDIARRLHAIDSDHTGAGTVDASAGVMPARRSFDAASLGAAGIDRINADLIAIERDWCAASFDDGRRWYRNGYAAPDATSGYAAWILPGVQAALLADDDAKLARQIDAVEWWLRGQRSRLGSIDALIDAAMPAEPTAAETEAPKPEFDRFDLQAVEVETDDESP
ncbi:MAG: M28 family peptidase [Phycisphaerales bacterium]